MIIKDGYFQAKMSDLENELNCTRQYFNGQFCGQPATKIVVDDIEPLKIQPRCEAHSRWGSKPFPPRVNTKYYGKYQIHCPTIMDAEEFVIFVVMYL